MISTLGNDIVSAYTYGSQVNAIYTYGVQVWPSGPEPSGYYIKWWPKDISGSFVINGETKYFEDYDGCYSGSFSSITVSGSRYAYIEGEAFKSTPVQVIETNVEVIGGAAFANCTSLVYASMSKCIKLGAMAGGVFANCGSLINVYIPSCITVGAYTFGHCSNLRSINIPNCKNVIEFAFQYCTTLDYISLPKCEGIDDVTFMNCTLLSAINLPVCSKIGPSAFYHCTHFSTMTLGYEGVCSGLGLANSPLGFGSGVIYVHSRYVSAYKERYSGLSSVFRPIQN